MRDQVEDHIRVFSTLRAVNSAHVDASRIRYGSVEPELCFVSSEDRNILVDSPRSLEKLNQLVHNADVGRVDH